MSFSQQPKGAKLEFGPLFEKKKSSLSLAPLLELSFLFFVGVELLLPSRGAQL
jgi:hypothetical protein